jgi:hypothetical protein
MPYLEPRKFEFLTPMLEHQFTQRAELLEPVDDRRKVVAGKLAELAGETDRAIGDQDLGLADPARML